MTSPGCADLRLLFEKIVGTGSLDQLCREQGYRGRRGIFTVPVVVWLMMLQRWQRGGSLAMAIQTLVQGEGGERRWALPCKRVREGRISPRTGGYCQARQKLPTLLVSYVADHFFEQLRSQVRGRHEPPLFVIDGTTLRLRHTPELVEAFPPGHNQHGGNHWPVLRMVAFHDAHTGLAARPSWGPGYGPHAVSEQHLAEQALHRLPTDAIVMGDSNFGIWAFARAVAQSGRPMILRLTRLRAQRLLGVLRNGTQRRLAWTPSRWERRVHPDLPATPLEGRVIVCAHPARSREKLCLFTTLPGNAAQILALYKMRWNIETDLRSLKRTIDLDQIHSQSVAMAEKEILMAVTAYNFIRAVMALAAQSAGLLPRQLSFAGVQAAVLGALPGLDQATTDQEYAERMDRLLRYAAQTRLPQRRRPRAYPREIWGRGGHFPFRKSSPLPHGPPPPRKN